MKLTGETPKSRSRRLSKGYSSVLSSLSKNSVSSNSFSHDFRHKKSKIFALKKSNPANNASMLEMKELQSKNAQSLRVHLNLTNIFREKDSVLEKGSNSKILNFSKIGNSISHDKSKGFVRNTKKLFKILKVKQQRSRVKEYLKLTTNEKEDSVDYLGYKHPIPPPLVTAQIPLLNSHINYLSNTPNSQVCKKFILALFNKIPFFAKFKPEMQLFIFKNCKVVVRKRGEWLFKEGDMGDSMYVILSGSINVLKLKKLSMESEELKD